MLAKWNKWNSIQNTQEIYFEYEYQGRVKNHGYKMALESDRDIDTYSFQYMFCFQLGWKEGKMVRLLQGNDND